MMAALMNKTNNQIVVPEVETASGLSKRLLGLMGRAELKNVALWIPLCNSVHTFFMRFPIDLAFVDSKMNVVALKREVKPWRLVLPVMSAYGVFELPTGAASKINLGDVLDVAANSDR